MLKDFEKYNYSINPLLYHKLLKLKSEKINPESKILLENLSENDALKKEELFASNLSSGLSYLYLCEINDCLYLRTHTHTHTQENKNKERDEYEIRQT